MKLDQYFLSKKSILEEEAAFAGLKKEDVVLEIGAGPGYLTRVLAKKARVIAVEKDERFTPELEKIENVQVYNEDIMDFFRETNESRKFNKVVSNIPYYLSQPILIELLKKRWDTCVLLVQKEFAEKAVAGGKLSLIVQDCCHATIEGFVPAEEFAPKGVDSALLVLKQKKIMDENLWEFLKKAYVMKNRNTVKLGKCPEKLKGKKIHQLALEEIREVYKMNKH